MTRKTVCGSEPARDAGGAAYQLIAVMPSRAGSLPQSLLFCDALARHGKTGFVTSAFPELLPPETAALPADASGDWFGAGTGWGYGERIGVTLAGQDAANRISRA